MMFIHKNGISVMLFGQNFHILYLQNESMVKIYVNLMLGIRIIASVRQPRKL